MPDFQTAYTPFQLGNLQLRNRFIKTATYEGMCRNGQPTPALIDFHTQMAKGGTAMTTVAYGAVNPLGRTHGDQMYLREELVPFLTRLTDSVKESGGATSIQLTHCGFFTRLRQGFRKPLAPSRIFNEYGVLQGVPFSRVMSREDLRSTVYDFAQAAKLAKQSGFDAVEIHMGHGYLLSQFLSPLTNRRTDEYGGPLYNRMRFPLEVLAAVRQSVGEDFPILCKINLSDGFKGGLSIEESVILAKRLEKDGANALVMSGGFTSKTPFYLLRGDIPLKEMIQVEKNYPQKLALRLFGKGIIKRYPFEENFFLQQALQVRKAVSMPLVYLGGVASKAGVEEVMQAGFDLIALGRALIHDPAFIQKLHDGQIDRSPCTHCNQCIVEMDREGVRCVL